MAVRDEVAAILADRVRYPDPAKAERAALNLRSQRMSEAAATMTRAYTQEMDLPGLGLIDVRVTIRATGLSASHPREKPFWIAFHAETTDGRILVDGRPLPGRRWPDDGSVFAGCQLYRDNFLPLFVDGPNLLAVDDPGTPLPVQERKRSQVRVIREDLQEALRQFIYVKIVERLHA